MQNKATKILTIISSILGVCSLALSCITIYSLVANDYDTDSCQIPDSWLSINKDNHLQGPSKKWFKQQLNSFKVLHIPQKVSGIDSSAFSGVLSSDDSRNYLMSLRFDSGSQCQQIGESAFSWCNFLNSLDFSNCHELIDIDMNAFYGCSNINCIDFTNCDSLIFISDGAFYGCDSVSKIAIPWSPDRLNYLVNVVPNLPRVVSNARIYCPKDYTREDYKSIGGLPQSWFSPNVKWICK